MAAKAQTQAPLSPARAQLQQAREAQQRARGLADKASKVVGAAAAAVERAREECAAHDEANEDSIASRLRALKGEGSAKNPEQLREARRNSLLAKEELLANDQVLQAAKIELEQAIGNIARGNKVCNSHITCCIGEAVNDVIAEWEKVNLERERLRAILGSLVMTPGVALDLLKPEQQHNIIQSAVSQAGLPFGDTQDWKILQAKANSALAHNFPPTDPGPGISRARAYWASFSNALLTDPAAPQPPLPSIAELFE